MKETGFSNIAVLIDAENVSHKYSKKIFECIAGFGQIAVCRVYADWTDNNRKGWRNLIRDYAFVPIQQFANKGTGEFAKNVSDFALVIDAMDLLHEDIYDCFCIVSSDSDFTRLAQRIREKGKFVIGIGEKKSIGAFVNACNKFICLDDKGGEKEIAAEAGAKMNKKRRGGAKEPLDDLISQAVDKLAGEDGWVVMSKIKPCLKQIKPDFDLSEYKVAGKTISRLGVYFEHNADYEYDKSSPSKAAARVRKRQKDT